MSLSRSFEKMLTIYIFVILGKYQTSDLLVSVSCAVNEIYGTNSIIIQYKENEAL